MEQGILNLARITTVDSWTPPENFPDLSQAKHIAIVENPEPNSTMHLGFLLIINSYIFFRSI